MADSTSPPSDDERADGEPSHPDDADRAAPRGRRDVVVPMRVYKTVTVFSTLIAVVSVVFGFVLLDAATLRFSVIRRLLVATLGAIGAAPSEGLLSGALAVVGLLSIAFGAGVYTLGTRFRARGMGNSQEDSDESSDNG